MQTYLAEHPDSAIAVNLKACNHYRLYNAKAAETEIKSLKHLATSDLSFGKDIVLHNTVNHLNQILSLNFL